MKFPDCKSNRTIAVLGDCFTDEYLVGAFHRFTPEGGQPIFKAECKIEVPGGAANTERQLSSWGVKTVLFGSHCGIKRRFVAGDNYFLRQDDEIEGSAIDYKEVVSRMSEFDAVVISDYDKGTLTAKAIQTVLSECNRRGVPCVVDPKHKSPRIYLSAVLKPNAAYALAMGTHPVESAVVTDGAYPPTIHHGNRSSICRPRHPVKAVSVVGAGDCFAAALAVSLADGLPLDDAAEVAYSAGRVYVQKRYNEPVQPACVHQDIDPTYSKIVTADMAVTRIPTGVRTVFTNGVFDLLGPHHVHHLQQSKAAGDFLIVGLNSDDSTRRLKGPGRPIQCQEDRAAVLANLMTVDLVVVFDEDTPTKLVEILQPGIITKDESYKGQNVPGSEFAKVVFTKRLEGRSTTALIGDIRRAS